MGSPPHTRGILHASMFDICFPRLTPAYAGNIILDIPLIDLVQAHPRIRGEYCVPCFHHHPTIGSPPHTRGIFFLIHDKQVQDRLTPAYAGNMRRCRRSHLAEEAHPRIRGEYTVQISGRKRHMGSPPHTRGIYMADPIQSDGGGLTPAYAGNINRVGGVFVWNEAHPRIRGEYRSGILADGLRRGSPPHTRGILLSQWA